MTKIMLDKAYAGRKPGDEIEASELEINALVAIGIVRRPLVPDAAVEDQAEPHDDETLPAIPLNPPASAVELKSEEEAHD